MLQVGLEFELLLPHARVTGVPPTDQLEGCSLTLLIRVDATVPTDR